MKQLVIPMLCLLPAARAAVQDGFPIGRRGWAVRAIWEHRGDDGRGWLRDLRARGPGRGTRAAARQLVAAVR